MNNQNAMVGKDDNNGLVDPRAMAEAQKAKAQAEEEALMNGFGTTTSGMMMRRDAVKADVPVSEKAVSDGKPPEKPDAEEKSFDAPAAQQPQQKNEIGVMKPETGSAKPVTGNSEQDKARADMAGMAKKAQESASNAQGAADRQKQLQAVVQQASDKASQQAAQVQAQQQVQPAQLPQPAQAIKIASSVSPDDMAKAYRDMFKMHFDTDLSSSMTFENMRKFFFVDNIKAPEKTLYYIENTYRLSTLLYLTGNLPILVIATVLSEKNRKNVLRYVSTEIENAAKPYDDLRKLRMSRYARKYENMQANDAMTVTLGVTSPTKELADAMISRFDDICLKMKKYNKDLMKSLAKLDEEALNDVVYIYSNCWYMLQGFENVPEMRSYVMAITDDTRANLNV